MTMFHAIRRRPCAVAAALLLALVPVAAFAQGAPDQDGPDRGLEMMPRRTPAGTALTLSGTGTIHAAPDRLTATLFAEATAATAATAQERANALARQAADAAGGLTVVTQDYSVQHDDDAKPPRQWTARQTISLTGTDGAALLDLVGKLQARGLALSGLDWSLSPDRRRDLTRQAEAEALKDVRARAAAAAGVLDLRVTAIRSISLSDQGMPRPMPVMMMAARALPPAAPAEEQAVTATATATFILRP